MLRRLSLIALAALAACDTTPLPERSNPFDPGSGDGRVAAHPSTVTLLDATPTSVTLQWDDRSSFEEGYVISGAPDPSRPLFPRDAIVLPPNTTSHTIDGMVGDGSVRLQVRALNGGPPALQGPAELIVRYPVAEAILLSAGAIGDLVPGAQPLLYRERTGAAPRVEAVRLDFEIESSASIQTFAGYDRLVGPLHTGEMVVEARTAGQVERDVAVVDAGGVQASIRLVSPGGAFVGAAAVAPDGSRLVAAYADGAGTRLASWEVRTGIRLSDGSAGPAFEPVVGVRMVTADGTAVVEEVGGDLVGVRLADGAERWRRTPRPIAASVVFDARGERVALARPDNRIEILDAGDGTPLQTLRFESVVGPSFLDGDFLGVADGGLTFIRRLPEGELIRVTRTPSRAAAAYVRDGVLVAHDGRERDARVFRLPLDAVWAADPE